MNAQTALLSVSGMLCLLVVLCFIITGLSMWFQKSQDRRFARPLKRRQWGWWADLALWWHTTRKK